jgi:orotate phosphoribosyltransferase
MTGHDQLIRLLASRAYQEGEFILSSGVASSFYLDAKQVTYHPDGVELVGSAVLDVARPFSIEAVGGLTMGADAIVSAAIWASRSTRNAIPGFVVRKEPKKHGLHRGVEGVSPAGLRVAVVDDVVTSGRSVLRAVEAARNVGAIVAVVIALVDREEGAAAAIEAAGVPFRSICTVSDIRAASRRPATAVA